jgi:hypothetical protein
LWNEGYSGGAMKRKLTTTCACIGFLFAPCFFDLKKQARNQFSFLYKFAFNTDKKCQTTRINKKNLFSLMGNNTSSHSHHQPTQHKTVRAFFEAQILKENANATSRLFSRVMMKNYCSAPMDELCLNGQVPSPNTNVDSVIEKSCEPLFDNLLACFEDSKYYKDAMKKALNHPKCVNEKAAAHKCFEENKSNADKANACYEKYTDIAIACGMTALLEEQ